MKWTRKDYMGGVCTHQEYYDQFVTLETERIIKDLVGEDKILASEDPYFNDINLRIWDKFAMYYRYYAEKLKKAGDFWSIAGMVCIAKAAARRIKARDIVAELEELS